MSLAEQLPRPARASFSEVFAEALRGRPCTVVGLGDDPEELPVHQWRRDADADDLDLLAHCAGPHARPRLRAGRLTAALAAARPRGARESTSSGRP